MRIGRLEVGCWRRGGKLFWRTPIRDYMLRGSCECMLLTCLCACVSWLGDECYGSILERRGKALRRLANIRRIRAERENTRKAYPER
jgi:hypothetical protein